MSQGRDIAVKYWPLILSLVAVSGSWATMDERIDTTRKQVDEVKREVEAHKHEPLHREAAVRLARIEEKQNAIKDDVEDILSALRRAEADDG